MTNRYWYLIVLLSFVCGSAYFFIELALISIPPLTLVFLRLALASLILLALLKAVGKKIPLNKKVWLAFAFMGMFNNVIPFCLISLGQVVINGSVACILTATTPIFTVILAHLFTQDERMSVIKILGVTVGFCGVYIMMYPSFTEEGLDLIGFGQAAIVMASFFYALSGVYGKRLKSIDPNISTVGMLICSSLFMIPIIFIFEDPFAISIEPVSVAAIFTLAILNTIIAYYLYFRVLANAGASYLMLFMFIMPISAMLLGISILGEIVDIYAITGMLVIFSGLIIIDGRVFKKMKSRILKYHWQ